MAYDEGLAHRIREMLEDRRGASEKRMFGGLCFLLNGHMVVGVVGSELMVRVGADAYDEALAHPDSREMDFTGRPLRGMVYVREDGVAEDSDLGGWVERGLRHAESLPPKGAAAPAARKEKASKPKAATRKPAKRKAAKKNAKKKKAAGKKGSRKKAAKASKKRGKKKAAKASKKRGKKTSAKRAVRGRA